MNQPMKRAPKCLMGLTIILVCHPNSHAEEAVNHKKGGLKELQHLLADQQKQIEELRSMLLNQQKVLASLQAESVHANPSALPPVAPPATPGSGRGIAEVASLTPILPPAPIAAAPTTPAVVPPAPLPAQQAEPSSPLQIPIGDATITPVGFMDLTNTFRSTNSGTSLQTNFGSFPYNNTIQGRLTENKITTENSRLGLRVDATVKNTHVLGYFEGDFVGGFGNGSNNGQVTSNSVLFRLRQYYVDVRKGFWEFLGGQAWSLILPNRTGMSPLPADLFYGQVVDANYINGLFWGRIPGFRFIGHPSDKVAFGFALENSTQYFGGSGGGGVPTLPAAFANNASYISSQLDNSEYNDRAVANTHPDIIAKFTVDPTSRLHFEMAGVESTVRLFNPNTNQYFYKAGTGGTLVLNGEIFKNFRVVTNNFWNNGNGRYLFGTAPDFIVRADGSPSLIHSASTVSGIETTIKSVFQPYIYYGGVYISRNTALDTDHSYIGYGYPGSPNSHNRSIQEITAGWTHTLWRDGKYGALQYMVQYAYFLRNPWYVAPGTPKSAHQNAVWFNLRYVLPGTAPTIKY